MLKLTVCTTFLKIGNGKWERRSSSSPTCTWEEAQIPSSSRQRFNCVYIYVETMDENYVSHIGIFSLNKCPDLLNFYMNISLTFANGIRVSWPWWTCCCFGFLWFAHLCISSSKAAATQYHEAWFELPTCEWISFRTPTYNKKSHFWSTSFALHFDLAPSEGRSRSPELPKAILISAPIKWKQSRHLSNGWKGNSCW